MLEILKVFLCTSLLFNLQSETAQIKKENVLEFIVCPQSHPIAINQGRQCSMPFNVGKTIKCKSSRCEHFYPTCDVTLFIKGIDDYDKIYSQNSFLEANRPIFQDEDKCVWWKYPNRNWWIGPCENVGTNSGFAYMEEDLDCPFDQPATWRKCGTDEVVKDLSISGAAVGEAAAASSATDTTATSGTAAVNSIIRSGKYQQKCRFVYRNGRFRCGKA